ncbi:transcriptional regulator [Listeria grandensis]|uniref:Transcriptional regulator n=1 Tax=Listeria grandensis TaxID=1494963 RepID=A0A7X1CPI3_9LIST|nr:two-component system activity regulator YycH [Listeria grandensis]MBC1473938.1 transcriptional regulator [Listeria grandensis]MBC1936040.1 transcriptional regulator [Listeria grandensis]
MKGTKIRGIILTVLVVISVFLSYSLWKVQPDYEVIDNETVKKEQIAKLRQPEQVFRPTAVYLHQNESNYVTQNLTMINALVKAGTTFDFSELVRTDKMNASYQEMMHQDDSVELVFPNAVPLSIYSQVFRLKGDNFDLNSFNRITFSLTKSENGLFSVYYGNDSNNQIYQGSIQQDQVNMLKQILTEQKTVLEPVDELYKNKQYLFLSDAPVKLRQQQYVIETIDIGLFKNALFGDGSKVKGQDNSFTNGSSSMTVNPDAKVLTYVDPAQERRDTSQLSSAMKSEQIQASFSFINDHWGWTGNYYYSGYSADSSTTAFSLFVQGLPVFNDDGMSQILVSEGTESVYKYQRPFFKLGAQITTESKEVTLPSSVSVYENLIKTVEPDDIQMIVPGYVMGYEQNNNSYNRVVELKPAWFYKYNGTWTPVVGGES